MEQTQQDHLSGMDLHIDSEVRQSLNESGKWTKFISITIFIMCGLMLLLCIVGSSTIMTLVNRLSSRGSNMFGEFSGSILVAIIIFVILIFAFIYYFLYNFSVKIKTALLSEDSGTFNKALSSLKTFFIITTVLAILSLLSSLYDLFG